MSKCQKNKYAAGGKCGSMGGAEREPCAKNSQINGNFAALLASREKQDSLFSTQHTPIAQPVQKIEKRAIIIKKAIAKSDIDTVLEGDF